ncbi:hypothetical protein CPB86DRAFT_796928 [Serendipita vermifera]|nr:hypothetical protein CPB86DRAFT_796928 [Serendipita vermifera]
MTSIVHTIERLVALREMMAVLTPRSNPYLIYQFFLNYIPSASLVQPNTLSNSDALSVLCYMLVITPESTHAWIIFKLFQEDALRENAGADYFHLSYNYTPQMPLLRMLGGPSGFFKGKKALIIDQL